MRACDTRKGDYSSFHVIPYYRSHQKISDRQASANIDETAECGV